MVARAWGAVNGTLITFTKTGDVWKADVPWLEDGEYAVEIYAEDEAGNTSYLCTMLFAVTGHQIKAHLVPRGYSAEPVCCPFEAQERPRKYVAEYQEGGYHAKLTGCRICND